MDVNPNSLSLKRALLIGEILSEPGRINLEKALHIHIHAGYGLSEVPGPGIAYDCAERRGLHINEDHFIAEIIDPESHEVLHPGEAGELVLTSLTARAFPLIRFRTGDMARLITEVCPCSRSFARLEAVPGRADHLVVIRGIKLHPQLIHAVMTRTCEGKIPDYVSFVRRQEDLDILDVMVEVDEACFSDEIKRLEHLVQLARAELEQSLGIPVKVRLVEPGTMADYRDRLTDILDERVNG